MAAPSLYVREKTPKGIWQYRRIKPGRGVKTGEQRAPFFTRPFVEGKRAWNILSAQSFKEAQEQAGQSAAALEAHSKRLTVAVAEQLRNAHRMAIWCAVDTYLEQKNSKAIGTVAQYRPTLNEFIEAIGPKVQFLSEVTENVLRSYKST